MSTGEVSSSIVGSQLFPTIKTKYCIIIISPENILTQKYMFDANLAKLRLVVSMIDLKIYKNTFLSSGYPPKRLFINLIFVLIFVYVVKSLVQLRYSLTTKHRKDYFDFCKENDWRSECVNVDSVSKDLINKGQNDPSDL